MGGGTAPATSGIVEGGAPRLPARHASRGSLGPSRELADACSAASVSWTLPRPTPTGDTPTDPRRMERPWTALSRCTIVPCLGEHGMREALSGGTIALPRGVPRMCNAGTTLLSGVHDRSRIEKWRRCFPYPHACQYVLLASYHRFRSFDEQRSQCAPLSVPCPCSVLLEGLMRARIRRFVVSSVLPIALIK